MESFNQAPQNEPEKEKTPMEKFNEQVQGSKEKAKELLGDVGTVRSAVAILGGNGLTVEQSSGSMIGAPKITLNKIDMSEPTPDEIQAVEALANFLDRAGSVMTRFPDQEYNKNTGHNLRLLWGNSLNTNPKNLLDEVEGLLNTATEF